MSLDNSASNDQEKLRRMIDYDILPEMELRLHSLIKAIHACMDDLIKIREELPDEEQEKVEAKVEGDDGRDVIQRINELQTETKQLEANLEKAQ